MDKKSELPKHLVEAIRPIIERIVEQILEEKRRQDPHALDDILAGPAVERRPFTTWSINK